MSHKKVLLKDINDLVLDIKNPRLFLSGNESQEKLIETIYSSETLDELAHSFHRNGYFWEELIVIVPSIKHKGKFDVVEGNRRIATLKLINNPALMRKLKVTDFPAFDKKTIESLREVPTVQYKNRDEVIPYLGFRHITGIKTWEPFAKARYVSQLVEGGRDISDIEESIGDSASTVKKLYQSYIVYMQIKNDLGLGTEEIRNNFSILEVTLGQKNIKKYLGMPSKLPSEQTDSVVPDEKINNLKEVISFVFGIKEEKIQRVISDSRQIAGMLAPIFENEESILHLKQFRNLESAYELCGGERNFLIKKIKLAQNSSKHILGAMSIYRDDKDIILELETLFFLTEEIKESLKKRKSK